MLAPAATIRRDRLDLLLVRVHLPGSHQHQIFNMSSRYVAPACGMFVSTHKTNIRPWLESQRARTMDLESWLEKRIWTSDD